VNNFNDLNFNYFSNT